MKGFTHIPTIALTVLVRFNLRSKTSVLYAI